MSGATWRFRAITLTSEANGETPDVTNAWIRALGFLLLFGTTGLFCLRAVGAAGF